MKYIAVVALALFSLAACHNADTNTRRQPATASTTDSATRRSALIKALQELQKAIASRDKHRIGDYFQFPVPDSVATFYTNDSAYDREREKEGEFTSERLFNTYFDKLAPFLQFDEFDTLFLRRLRVRRQGTAG